MRRFVCQLVLGVVLLVALVALWGTTSYTGRLVLHLAGVNTAPLHELDSGDVDEPPGYTLTFFGGLVIALAVSWLLARWYVARRRELTERKARTTPAPAMGESGASEDRFVRDRASRHPRLSLVVLVVVVGALAVVLGGIVADVDEDAHRRAITELTASRDFSPEQARCVARGLDDRFVLAGDIHMNASNAAAILRLSLVCTDIAEAASNDCLVDEVLKEAERWEHPADALFPFEDGNLDGRELEQAMIRCSVER